MKNNKRTVIQQKIVEGMDKVYDNLLEFKKQKNTELVVLQGDRIIKIKP